MSLDEQLKVSAKQFADAFKEQIDVNEPKTIYFFCDSDILIYYMLGFVGWTEHKACDTGEQGFLTYSLNIVLDVTGDRPSAKDMLAMYEWSGIEFYNNVIEEFKGTNITFSIVPKEECPLYAEEA